jgi:hypothetical protein
MTAARILLGTIRLANGSLALLAPAQLADRLGVDPEENPAMLYVLRMFGIRTVLIARDLLAHDQQARAKALRRAPLIHASDTLAAGLAAASGKLPRRAAVLITAVSVVNTALALAARGGRGAR